jgi:hypothetical protein
VKLPILMAESLRVFRLRNALLLCRTQAAKSSHFHAAMRLVGTAGKSAAQSGVYHESNQAT